MSISASQHDLTHPCPKIIYEFVRGFVLFFFRVFHCVQIRGKQHIPMTGPVIVAPNHVSYYDPLLVGLAIPRAVRTMAWDALFKVPLLGWSMKKLGAFAVEPRQADTSAYKQSLLLLRHGQCVMIFPEGRRGDKPEIEPFETGVARLALRTGAIVVPATITGALEAWPRWRKVPAFFRPMQLVFHPPVQPKARDLHGEELRQATEDLNEAIRRPIERRYAAYWRLKKKLNKRIPAAPKA